MNRLKALIAAGRFLVPDGTSTIPAIAVSRWEKFRRPALADEPSNFYQQLDMLQHLRQQAAKIGRLNGREHVAWGRTP
jgi:hypothetical protein